METRKRSGNRVNNTWRRKTGLKNSDKGKESATIG